MIDNDKTGSIDEHGNSSSQEPSLGLSELDVLWNVSQATKKWWKEQMRRLQDARIGA